MLGMFLLALHFNHVTCSLSWHERQNFLCLVFVNRFWILLSFFRNQHILLTLNLNQMTGKGVSWLSLTSVSIFYPSPDLIEASSIFWWPKKSEENKKNPEDRVVSSFSARKENIHSVFLFSHLLSLFSLLCIHRSLDSLTVCIHGRKLLESVERNTRTCSEIDESQNERSSLDFIPRFKGIDNCFLWLPSCSLSILEEHFPDTLFEARKEESLPLLFPWDSRIHTLLFTALSSLERETVSRFSSKISVHSEPRSSRLNLCW